MCWGSEMGIYMSQCNSDWLDVINGIRSRYNGPILVTQHTLEDWRVAYKIGFINNNDYQGLNMYHHLTKVEHSPIDYDRNNIPDVDPTAAELMEDWDDMLTMVADFRSTNNITVPLLYPEVGYVSWDICNAKYKYGDMPLDLEEHKDCFEAMVTQSQKRDFFHGFDWWSMDQGSYLGGRDNPMHGVSGKPASDVFAREYLRVDLFEHHVDSADLNGDWTDVNSNVTMTLETTEVQRGAQSMKMAVNTTSNDAVVRYDTSKVGCWDLGDSNPALTFWFKGDASLDGDLKVELETTTQTIGIATYTDGASQLTGRDGRSIWTTT